MALFLPESHHTCNRHEQSPGARSCGFRQARSCSNTAASGRSQSRRTSRPRGYRPADQCDRPVGRKLRRACRRNQGARQRVRLKVLPTQPPRSVSGRTSGSDVEQQSDQESGMATKRQPAAQRRGLLLPLDRKHQSTSTRTRFCAKGNATRTAGYTPIHVSRSCSTRGAGCRSCSTPSAAGEAAGGFRIPGDAGVSATRSRHDACCSSSERSVARDGQRSGRGHTCEELCLQRAADVDLVVLVRRESCDIDFSS